MAWLGARDLGRSPVYHPESLEVCGAVERVPFRYLSSGTFVVETDVPDAFDGPRDLIRYNGSPKNFRAIHLVFGPNKRIILTVESKKKIAAIHLDVGRWDRLTPVRISYAWDWHRGEAWLSAENLLTGEIRLSTSTFFHALIETDLARILYCQNSEVLGPSVSYFAFGNHPDQAGYSDGFASGTLVETEAGNVPIEQILPGSLVVNSLGDFSKVIGVVSSNLPNFGASKMLKILRPFQQLSDTLTVSGQSSFVTNGSDANYLFQKEKVSLKAHQVLRFSPGRDTTSLSICRRWNLLLEGDPAYVANGVLVRPFRLCHNEAAHKYTRFAKAKFAKLASNAHEPWNVLERHEAIALLSARYA